MKDFCFCVYHCSGECPEPISCPLDGMDGSVKDRFLSQKRIRCAKKVRQKKEYLKNRTCVTQKKKMKKHKKLFHFR